MLCPTAVPATRGGRLATAAVPARVVVVVLSLCSYAGGITPSPVQHYGRKLPPPHKPPPPPPRPTLDMMFSATVTTNGFTKSCSRPAVAHHATADYWIDSTVLGIRKTHSDLKSGKNFTTIKLVKDDAEYSMRPFFNETACYKFPLNKPTGKDPDIFHQMVANELYGGVHQYWQSTQYKGLVHGEGCPTKGCQKWSYFHAAAPPTDSHSTVHGDSSPAAADGKPPPPPPKSTRKEWGEFWINGNQVVQVRLRSVTTGEIFHCFSLFFHHFVTSPITFVTFPITVSIILSLFPSFSLRRAREQHHGLHLGKQLNYAAHLRAAWPCALRQAGRW